MTRYRVYSVGADGRIFGDRFIDARNDEEAISTVRSWQRPDPCELWIGDRRVAKILPREG